MLVGPCSNLETFFVLDVKNVVGFWKRNKINLCFSINVWNTTMLGKAFDSLGTLLPKK